MPPFPVTQRPGPGATRLACQAGLRSVVGRLGRSLLLWVLMGACGRAPDSRVADGREETSGARPSSPEWTLVPAPDFQIRGEDAASLFMVTSAARTLAGVVVANAGTGELRWFDGAGRPVRAAGRRGSGPGEFQHIGWVGVLPDDSIAAWDPVLRRLSVFDPAGQFTRTTPLSAIRGPLPSVIGLIDGRTLLIAARTRTDPPPGAVVWRDSTILLRVGVSGAPVDTIGTFAGTDWYGGGSRVQTVPFGRQTVAAVSGNTLYVGTGERYEIGTYAPDGTPRGRIGKPHEPLRVRPQDRDAFLASVIQVGGTEADRRERTRMLAKAPFPETMPPYTSFLADPAGNLWVRETQPSGAMRRSTWAVFDPGGRWIATVRGPDRLKAFQIGDNWMLAAQNGTDGGENVVIYQVQRP